MNPLQVSRYAVQRLARSTTVVSSIAHHHRCRCRFMSTLRADINPRVGKAQYAVRGEIVDRAESIKQNLKKPAHEHPFDAIIHCNIGNPQELGQKPLTFVRQVLSLCQYPTLLQHNDIISKVYDPDAVQRAKHYLENMSGGMGAYTHSKGLPVVREEVAAFIAARDGQPADPNMIYLTSGASSAVNIVMTMLIGGHTDGILTPLPQYPLYTATMALLGGETVGYYLEEKDGWALNINELTTAYESAKSRGITTRALVVINPGNPTGQCLPRKTMEMIIQFCDKHHLALLADEVYQANIYGNIPFISFKKVITEMNNTTVPLFSFHSTSKGFTGECGQRGGYVELYNIHEEVQRNILKLQSISLCANTSGQLTVGLMVNPPANGSQAYQKYIQERDTILDSLKRRALHVAETMNSLDGISCQPVSGAMYAFPSIKLSQKAIAAAKEVNKAADAYYCMKLLESTGMCCVPGSGFGQREGHYHFRTTILPAENEMKSVLQKFIQFHNQFMKEYAD